MRLTARARRRNGGRGVTRNRPRSCNTLQLTPSFVVYSHPVRHQQKLGRALCRSTKRGNHLPYAFVFARGGGEFRYQLVEALCRCLRY